MSSVSGDENNEVADNEPVRRTRSGRAVKAVAVAKKTPAKKPSTRATRASRNIQEIEEEPPQQLEDESNENGVQQDLEDNSAFIEPEPEPENEMNMTEMQFESNEEMQVDQMEENMIQEQENAPEQEFLQETEQEQEQEEEENVADETMADETMADENMVKENNQYVDEENSEETDNTMEQNFQENFEEKENTENETDQIPEFDPEEINPEVSESVPMSSEEVNEPSEEQTSQNTGSLRVKDTSEIMETNTDEQFILIEDDVDQQLDTVAGLDNAEGDEETDKNYSQQDSEIILDNDQFRNEDVEFISETNEHLETASQKEESQEVIEISDHEGETPGKKSVPDTEAVSEDELPTEGAKEPETEAVSDEELPAAQPADLGETESVSDDELPLESEKKRKNKTPKKAVGKKAKVETPTNKRKRTAEGEYDPSSPTSENNDETPSKKILISSDSNDKPEAKPASPKKKVLPELEKYWKAVHEDPSDFTGWTYLLQYVDQENDAEAAREAYGKFLERYPYCYGYWRKYADYEKKKGDPARVQMTSTSCGTYATLLIYGLTTRVTYQLERSFPNKLPSECNYYLFILLINHYYNAILHLLHKSVSSLLSPNIISMLLIDVRIIITHSIKCVLLLYFMCMRFIINNLLYERHKYCKLMYTKF